MITEWRYNPIGGERDKIKEYIKNNNLNTIDLGAAADFWSYPECKTVVDSEYLNRDDINLFQVNFEKEEEWFKVLDFVNKNGKFDFSICSHTLEDISSPFDIIKKLEQISNAGFIAIPSKFNEFRKLYNNKYRGNAHHKQFFDIKNDTLVLYPKYSWIEVDERSNKVFENSKGEELTLMWVNNIDYMLFNDGKPFKDDGNLISTYYNEILISEK